MFWQFTAVLLFFFAGFRSPDSARPMESCISQTSCRFDSEGAVTRLEVAEWAPAGSVVELTHESGDVYVFARDARTLYLGTSPAGTSDEVCKVSWQSGPMTVECSVVKKWGETKDEWKSRCADAVAKLQEVFPPNPPQ